MYPASAAISRARADSVSGALMVAPHEGVNPTEHDLDGGSGGVGAARHDERVTLVDELAAAGAGAGRPLGVAAAPFVGAGLACGDRRWTVAPAELRVVDEQLHPRWTWWGRPTTETLVGARLGACWDVTAVHRLLFGGGDTDPSTVWARTTGLDVDRLPAAGQLDFLGGATDSGDDDDPVRPDGYLQPDWVDGGWHRDADRLATWAAVALRCAERQRELLGALDAGGDPLLTAWSESTAELLAVELQVEGLPLDSVRARELITAVVGPAPRDDADAARLRGERDRRVTDLPGAGVDLDLRNPADVRTLLGGIGIDVPDTRSWRLEPLRASHPLVDALLEWRKAERVATTYGHGWLDSHVRDGRLRGRWSGSDGAAGRMTAQAGLHNLPAELRPAVAAEPGRTFVRADLGQIEPRVLAVVSGDPDLARAGAADDLYAPVAQRLGVERPVAKVAVLAAMYGQTSGTAGEALRGLHRAYPVAMAYLDDAYERGRAGRDVRTHGGRLVRMPPLAARLDEAGVRAAQGARGRYARNALVQGAAAEFFKMWAVTVRARLAPLDARIVLCLHDELLVHVPTERADAAAATLVAALEETAHRWQRGRTAVRFVADVSVVARWSDAKG
ncbi:DNA polymerase [uncultured Jatrophihabitans sp.]|uniref:DNA polymerase n=1 Tax=uncultured Jatrophihabitans sp. TaxID=1610747 RepID=UPI0035CBF05C